MRGKIWTLGSVLFVLFGVLAAFAQIPTGVILGRVKDSSGAASPNAAITATNRETGLVRSTQTGGDGRFTLPGLPVGTYDVKAEAASFTQSVQQGLALSVGQEAVLTFSLSVGSVQE